MEEGNSKITAELAADQKSFTGIPEAAFVVQYLRFINGFTNL